MKHKKALTALWAVVALALVAVVGCTQPPEAKAPPEAAKNMMQKYEKKK
ncbi:MAG: hypothetical protein K2X38_04370 [Gemmataceae bacterium]|nr:hypothetical protein [Gemmataceae bacterium]